LADHFRCPQTYVEYAVAGGLSAGGGFFRFGEKAVCYGRTSSGPLRVKAKGDLYDVLSDVSVQSGNAVLPFELAEVVDNLRYERYARREESRSPESMAWWLAGKAYYAVRPLMPVAVRKHLQRIYLNGWDRIAFPSWPVDRTVEDIFEKMVSLSIQCHRIQKLPFVWFWPKGCSACAIVTHDVETEAGRDFSVPLAALDASFGIKSAFQIVPEKRYAVPAAFLDSIRSRGCEVNVHGLNHEGNLFGNRDEFLRQAERINRYAKQYGAAGFRSPVMYRNVDWLDRLDFSYDMSVPNSAHLAPQQGGCCTVMPYFIGNIVELPLTTTQDYALFNILRHRSIGLWKRQIELVLERHGLLSFNIHPDYIVPEACFGLYRQLLEHLTKVCVDQGVWMALPGEVDLWWRQRREMQIVNDGGRLRVSGPSSERAVVAYASLENGEVVYEFHDAPALQPSEPLKAANF